MDSCHHRTLELLPERKNRLRCRYCHLTIDVHELGGGYCPECFEARGKKHYEFEEIEPGVKDVVRYRCMECGIIVGSE